MTKRKASKAGTESRAGGRRRRDMGSTRAVEGEAQGITQGRRKCGRDAGSMSMEAVLIVPAFLLFLVALAAVGAVAGVRQDVHAAAVQGAREASMESSASAGVNVGHSAVNNYLNQEKTPCQTRKVEVQAAALDSPSGHMGSVTVRVTCVVSLAQFTGIGLPGQITVEEEFTAQIDAYVDR